jgi:predicted nucleotidyltransferase
VQEIGVRGCFLGDRQRRPDDEGSHDTQLRIDGPGDTLVAVIVALAEPRRIILLGSAARGTSGPDGDIDLLVVVRDGTHRRRTVRMLYRCIEDVTVPFGFAYSDLSLASRREDIPVVLLDTLAFHCQQAA